MIEKDLLPVELNDSMTVPDYGNVIDATQARLYREILKDGVRTAARRSPPTFSSA